MSKNKISSSKHRKGSFASQAKRAGMSLPKFANYVIRNYRDETSSYNPTIKTYRRAIYYKDTIPNRKSKRGKTKRRKMKARMDIPRTSSGPIELSLVEKERTRELTPKSKKKQKEEIIPRKIVFERENYSKMINPEIEEILKKQEEQAQQGEILFYCFVIFKTAF